MIQHLSTLNWAQSLRFSSIGGGNRREFEVVILVSLLVLINVRALLFAFGFVVVRRSLVWIFGGMLWDFELRKQRGCPGLTVLLWLARHLLFGWVPRQRLLLGLRIAVLLLLGLRHRDFAFNDLSIDLVLLLVEHAVDGFFVLECYKAKPPWHQRSVYHDHTLLDLSEATEVQAQRFFCRCCSESSDEDFPMIG